MYHLKTLCLHDIRECFKRKNYLQLLKVKRMTLKLFTILSKMKKETLKRCSCWKCISGGHKCNSADPEGGGGGILG